MVTIITSNRYAGLSTDDKPTTIDQVGRKWVVPTNALFLELDTGKFYYFTGADWAEVGGEA